MSWNWNSWLQGVSAHIVAIVVATAIITEAGLISSLPAQLSPLLRFLLAGIIAIALIVLAWLWKRRRPKTSAPENSRIFANISLVELARILEPLTTTARNERLKAYDGKWFTIESTVLDVENKGSRVDVSSKVIEPFKVVPLADTGVEMKDFINATLLFAGSSWPQLSHAQRGFYIKAEGQISVVPHYTHIIYDNCVLVHLGSSNVVSENISQAPQAGPPKGTSRPADEQDVTTPAQLSRLLKKATPFKQRDLFTFYDKKRL
jgi:hypothetical protein